MPSLCVYVIVVLDNTPIKLHLQSILLSFSRQVPTMKPLTCPLPQFPCVAEVRGMYFHTNYLLLFYIIRWVGGARDE